MTLTQLIEGLTVSKLYYQLYGQMATTQDIVVNSVQYDSRKIAPGDCFVAIKGGSGDGHEFVEQAVTNGAKVVVLEREEVLPDPLCMHGGVAKIVVPDSRKALAIIAANLSGHPADRMTIVGITGTNGKTTTSYLVKAVLEAAKFKSGLVGTIQYMVGSTALPATHTTPESLELQQLFASMESEGCKAVSMEVSSHALHQSRVHGIPFRVGIFTNLTLDHLDYHHSMNKYFEAKKILFDNLGEDAAAIVNAEDEWSERIVGGTKARKITYGIKVPADIQAVDLNMSMNGTTFGIMEAGTRTKISTSLVGRFNVSNVLAAFGAGRALGIEPRTIATALASVKNIRGRFERIASPAGWTAIIDYAHTPDAMENCLRTIHDLLPRRNRGRIITVFGAGGDRDRSKRPLMGKIAARYSDVIIITSDNPRTETPEKIIDDIARGIRNHRSVTREPDRREAIEHALGVAQRGDVVLIAGKGHEEYQVTGTERKHFSDREVVEESIR